jgi:hypothetical protein
MALRISLLLLFSVQNAIFFININLYNCSCNCICCGCNCICIVVCSVSFIVRVVLCAVFCLSVMCCFV